MNPGKDMLRRYLHSAATTKGETMPELSEVQRAVDFPSSVGTGAAAKVATLEPDKWAGWVEYLLEALEEEAADRLWPTPDDYHATLQAVHEAIEGRLERGQW